MAGNSYRDNILARTVAIVFFSIMLLGCASQQEKADQSQQEEVPASSPSSSSSEEPSADQSEAGEQSASNQDSQSKSNEAESGQNQSIGDASQQGPSAEESKQGESGQDSSQAESSDSGSQQGSTESAGSDVGQQSTDTQGEHQRAAKSEHASETIGQSGVVGTSNGIQQSSVGSSGGYGGTADGATGVAMGTGDIADLDKILNESLGEFDGTMAAEQEILAASGQGSAQSAGERESNDATAVVSASGSRGQGGVPEMKDVYGDGAGSYGGDTKNADDGVQNSAGNQAGKADGLTEEQRRERIPEDISSDGKGEDVVARQIRELAMQEEDPELREAIWDEYRKHTGTNK
ncbi:MAG: hypothetical protein P8R04_03020 [Gammaproteobacteria bacterium]|nr:hypothetical protein [Gammaproteobacteria bacterium]